MKVVLATEAMECCAKALEQPVDHEVPMVCAYLHAAAAIASQPRHVRDEHGVDWTIAIPTWLAHRGGYA